MKSCNRYHVYLYAHMFGVLGSNAIKNVTLTTYVPYEWYIWQ